MNSLRDTYMKTGKTIQPTWLHGVFMLNIWWPVLAFTVYSVYSRVQGKFLAGLLTASGIDGDPSMRDILFLYRQDLLIFGVLLPLLTAACFVMLRFIHAALLTTFAVLATQVLLYVNLQSWGQVGSFLTWQAFLNAIAFGLSNPEFIGEYLSLRGVVRLLALLLISTAILVAGRRFWHWHRLIRTGALLGTIGVVTSALLALAGFSSGMHTAPISGSFVVNAIRALESTSVSPQRQSAVELDRQYRQLSQLSLPAVQGPNFAVHRGSNLLMFILETGSVEFLDVRRGLPEHPILDLLRGKTYVAANHFTTFPASAESNLSILTGIYPPRAIYGTCLIDVPRANKALPGPIPILRAQGYKTGIYAPYRSQVPADKVVFEGTGFEHVVYGDDLSGPGGADNRTLERLIDDIKQWTGSKQQFAAVFLPQVGHGPWSPSLGGTVQERGANVVMQQLDWLGRVIEVIRSAGQLDNTIIILTGDHGVRTLMEDPRVKVGMIDWYSFQVPLLIYAPKANYTGLSTAIPSSHIDISAELAELFGQPHLQSYQGVPFHHPERATRRQFLMAGWYFGANGFRDSGGAAMYSDMLDTAYMRPDGLVDFGVAQVVTNTEQKGSLQDKLVAMTALQESWIASLACPN